MRCWKTSLFYNARSHPGCKACTCEFPALFGVITINQRRKVSLCRCFLVGNKKWRSLYSQLKSTTKKVCCCFFLLATFAVAFETWIPQKWSRSHLIDEKFREFFVFRLFLRRATSAHHRAGTQNWKLGRCVFSKNIMGKSDFKICRKMTKRKIFQASLEWKWNVRAQNPTWDARKIARRAIWKRSHMRSHLRSHARSHDPVYSVWDYKNWTSRL